MKKKTFKDEGTMSLSEAYTRGLLLVMAAVGSVFAYQFLQDLYRSLFHGEHKAG